MRFMVFEENPLVLLDIQMALSENFPDATIAAFSEMPKSQPALDGLSACILILDRSALALFDSASINALTHSGGGIVIMGEPEISATGIAYLTKPFNNDMLIEAIWQSLSR